MSNGRARALVPTEPGAHSLCVIVQDWAAFRVAERLGTGALYKCRALRFTSSPVGSPALDDDT